MRTISARILCLAAALLLCLTAAFAEQEQTPAKPPFHGMTERIAFGIPAMGRVFHEGATPGYIEDTLQLYGFCGDKEFTVRTARIDGWIEGMLAEYPDENPYHVRANTLIQYAAMIPASYGAQPTDMHAHDDGESISASFHFTYPDMPGVDFEGAAILNVATGRAVTVYGECCDMLTACIGALRFVSEEEQAAWDSREPETMTFAEMSAVFPIPVQRQQSGDLEVVGCLTDRFEYLAVQELPGVALEIPADDAEAQTLLERTADRVILPTMEGTKRIVGGSTFTRPAEGVAMLSFTCGDPTFGDFGTVYLCALCVTPGCVYYVWSTDTQAGRAFLDSFAWGGR